MGAIMEDMSCQAVNEYLWLGQVINIFVSTPCRQLTNAGTSKSEVQYCGEENVSQREK